MDVSIIIPFYNTKLKFLEELFKNITISKRNNLEFIFIDDGSDADSSKVVSDFCNHNGFIFFRFEKNSGVSNARNKGIELATKPYLFFCDSDDLVDFSFLNDVFPGDCDLYLFKDSIVKNNIIENQKLVRKTLNKNLLECYLSDNDGLNLRSSCCKLIKKSFLTKNQINFDTELRFYEDSLFMCNYYLNAPSFEAFENRIYFYRLYSTSSSKKFNKKYFLYYEKYYWKFKNQFKNEPLLFKGLMNDTFRKVLIDKFVKSFKKFHFLFCLSIFKQNCIIDASEYFLQSPESSNYEKRLAKHIIRKNKLLSFFSIIYYRLTSSIKARVAKLLKK